MFSERTSMMVNKANDVLGFIKRWSKDFTDSYVTKQLKMFGAAYSWIWVCYMGSFTLTIFNLYRKRFLLFCLRGRRIMLSLSFLLSLRRGYVYSDYLLRKINFNVSIRPSRNFNLLNLQFHRSVYANKDPFRQICLKFNNLYHLTDLSESNYSLTTIYRH